MADDRDDLHEGWHVPFRLAAIGGAAVPVVLIVAVVISGRIYDHTLRPKVQYTVTPQPAPGLEADIHAGVSDHEPPPPIVRTDPAIARAEAETAAQGLVDWPAGNAQ